MATSRIVSGLALSFVVLSFITTVGSVIGCSNDADDCIETNTPCREDVPADGDGCIDGVDNDRDGDLDCDDPDCSDDPDCKE